MIGVAHRLLQERAKAGVEIRVIGNDAGPLELLINNKVIGVGETVKVKAPRGTMEFKILEIGVITSWRRDGP